MTEKTTKVSFPTPEPKPKPQSYTLDLAPTGLYILKGDFESKYFIEPQQVYWKLEDGTILMLWSSNSPYPNSIVSLKGTPSLNTVVKYDKPITIEISEQLRKNYQY